MKDGFTESSERQEVINTAFTSDVVEEIPEILPDQLLNTDPVKDYLRKIAKIPLLNAETEVELAKTIEAGLMAQNILDNKTKANKRPGKITNDELEWFAEQGAEAKARFLESNLKLVVSIAKKYNGRGVEQMDLIQEGNDGLIRAVEKFDYTKGFKFSTYATWWIRQAITRGIAQKSRNIRIPNHRHEEVNQLIRTTRDLENKGEYVTPEMLAKELDMPVEDIKALQGWAKDTISLDTPAGENSDVSLGDLIDDETSPDPTDEALDNDLKESINKLLHTLTEREETILTGRFGLNGIPPIKLAEIGQLIGVSAERVRQIERALLQRLRSGHEADILRDYVDDRYEANEFAEDQEQSA